MNGESNSVYLLPAMENNYMDLLTTSIPDDAKIIRQPSKQPFTVFLDDILQEQPDTIHMHWPHPYFLFFGIFPTKLLSTFASAIAAGFFLVQFAISSKIVDSTVWTLHNRHNHDSLQPTIERLVHITLGYIADTVTVWDKTTMEVAEEEFGINHEKLEIVPHNNYDPIYGEIKESDASSTCNDVCEQAESYDRVLLYFGRIREYKDVIGMVEAFNDTNTDDTCLIVAGNPTENMASEVEKVINMTGDVLSDLRYISDEDVPRYFETADIAVFPYKKIFNSGSILLAMTFGTPFVAPSMGAIPGISPDGNIIYDQLEEGLSDAIGLSEDEVKRIGSRNRHQAESGHSQEEVRKALVRAYDW